MSIVVEHEKRRKEILEHALDVFMDEGFEDATFQKIADRSGITRTTLYIYFKNKREIFNYSIKQMLSKVEKDLMQLRKDKESSSIDRITNVMCAIIDILEENRRLLSVILNYLLHLSKSGVNPEDRVLRRTIRMRHILSAMVIEGVKSGEIAPVNIRTIDDLLYGLIESAIFRLVVLCRDSVKEIKEDVKLAIHRLKLNPDV
jgi:AcrR family transcriptional regulator